MRSLVVRHCDAMRGYLGATSRHCVRAGRSPSRQVDLTLSNFKPTRRRCAPGSLHE
jgi:hypothetical protein